MEVRCTSCGTRYAVSDDKVRGRRGRFPCRKCGTKVEIDGTRQEASAGPVAAPAPVPAPPVPVPVEKKPLVPAGAGGASAAPSWSVAVGGKEPRSLTLATISLAYRAGTISRSTYVWSPGMPDWVRLIDAAELVSGLRALGIDLAPEPPAPVGPSGGLFSAADDDESTRFLTAAAVPDAVPSAAAGLSSAMDEDEATRLVTMLDVESPAGAPDPTDDVTTFGAARLPPPPFFPGKEGPSSSSGSAPVPALASAMADDDATRIHVPDAPPAAAPEALVRAAAVPATVVITPAVRAAPTPGAGDGRSRELTGKTRIVRVPQKAKGGALRAVVLMGVAGLGGFAISQVMNARRAAPVPPPVALPPAAVVSTASSVRPPRPAPIVPTREDEVTFETVPKAPEAPSAAKPSAPARRGEAPTSGHAAPARPAPVEPAPVEPPAAPALPAPVEPPAAPVAPEPPKPVAAFDAAAARAALASAVAAAESSCRVEGQPNGEALATVQLVPSGRAAQVQVKGPLGPTPTGLCIVRRLQLVSVAAFGGESVTLSTKVLIR